VAYIDGRVEIGTIGISKNVEIVGNVVDLKCTHPSYDLSDLNANTKDPWIYRVRYCLFTDEESCKVDPVVLLKEGEYTPTKEELHGMQYHMRYKEE
jgi:hypothetical protein